MAFTPHLNELLRLRTAKISGSAAGLPRFGNIFVQDLLMRCIWPFRRSCSVPENACFKVLTHRISVIDAPNTFPLRTQRMSSSLSESSQRTKGQLLGSGFPLTSLVEHPMDFARE